MAAHEISSLKLWLVNIMKDGLLSLNLRVDFSVSFTCSHLKWAFLLLRRNALGITTGIRVIVVVSAMMIRLKQLESSPCIIEMYELLVHYDQRKSRIKVIKEQMTKFI